MRRDTPRTIARVDRIDGGDLVIRQGKIDDVDVLGAIGAEYTIETTSAPTRRRFIGVKKLSGRSTS